MTAPDAIQKDRQLFYDHMRAVNAKRYKTYDELSMKVLFSFIQTYVMSESHLAGRILQAGMTLSGLNVLGILRMRGSEGCPLNALSRLLLVSRANITGLVDSLVRKGFVVREDHKRDRRVILAKITKAGEAWMDKYLPSHYQEIQRMFSGLTKPEKEELNRLLTKLRCTGCSHSKESR